MAQRDMIRWGDSERAFVPANTIVQVRQLVNVEAPHPCSWSLGVMITGHTIAQALSAVVLCRCGVGSVMVELPLTFAAIAEAPFSSVQTIPAQQIAASVQLFSPVGDFNVDVAVWVAPFIPWMGLDVDAVGERIHVEDPYR